ncbi:MAG TPA: YciI family protein [Actinomycetota bacterium]|nr:YciI family protein [Actinomycetota bacterium]
MRYILLIYGDEAGRGAMSEDDRHAMYAEYEKFANEITERGIGRGGDELSPVSSATTVREREGTMLVTDGPFAETKEQLGGYFIVDVDDLDTAIELASKIPAVHGGSVEIRPIVD